MTSEVTIRIGNKATTKKCSAILEYDGAERSGFWIEGKGYSICLKPSEEDWVLLHRTITEHRKRPRGKVGVILNRSVKKLNHKTHYGKRNKDV